MQFQLVSIGLPVYNGAAYLRQALDSLLAQDYQSFELVISDNGSTDETPAICREYAERDQRIRYLRSDRNRGSAWNFCEVVRVANGTFFMWAAHDDLWHPSFISKCMAALAEDSSAVLCHSYGTPIDPEGKVYGESYIGWVNDAEATRARWRHVLRRWELHAAIYGLMRREVLDRTRLLQPLVSSDLIFVAEMSVHGKVIQVPEILQWKRGPGPQGEYRSYREVSLLVGAKETPSLRLHRLRTFLACAEYLKLIHISVPQRLLMLFDAAAVYLTSMHWIADARDVALHLKRLAGSGRRRTTKLPT